MWYGWKPKNKHYCTVSGLWVQVLSLVSFCLQSQKLTVKLNFLFLFLASTCRRLPQGAKNHLHLHGNWANPRCWWGPCDTVESSRTSILAEFGAELLFSSLIKSLFSFKLYHLTSHNKYVLKIVIKAVNNCIDTTYKAHFPFRTSYKWKGKIMALG